MTKPHDSQPTDSIDRRGFLAVAAAGAVGATLPTTAGAQPAPTSAPARSRRPKVLLFDVNETLLDLALLKPSVAAALGGKPELVTLWFTTLLHYSLVATVGDRYADFGQIGTATLRMVAKNQGIDLSEADAKAALAPMRSLPAHADVAPALQKLKAAGYRMVTLTNSSRAAVDAQIEHAGLAEFFEQRMTVEDVGLYKPHGHVYRWASHKLGVEPADCMLIAAHGWDVAGAMWAGCRAAFLARPGQQLYPLAATPEIVTADLAKAADTLIAMPA